MVRYSPFSRATVALLTCQRDTGPIVRVGPNQLSFATVEAQKMIYNAKPTHTGSDELFGREGTLQDVLLSMILGAANIGSLSNRAEHKKMRKRLQPGFTSKALFEQESLLRLHMDRLLERLAQDTGVIDLTQYFSTFLWDLIGDLSFGEPLVREKHGASSLFISSPRPWSALLSCPAHRHVAVAGCAIPRVFSHPGSYQLCRSAN